MKRIKELISKIHHTQVLSAIFVVLIIYISIASLPSTVYEIISTYVKIEQKNVFSLHWIINEAYRNMLAFNGSYLINKGAYINLNGLMANTMGQRYMNERVELSNGHLTFLTEKSDVTLAATQMTKMSNVQKQRGKHFLFVLAPFQVPKYEEILPAGYEDYSNENADDMLGILRQNDVDILDLREEMFKEGISWDEAFFVTDHHWKPETGFWAYTKIVEYFENMGIAKPVDSMYTDIGNYNVDVYKDWFLGAAGKRTGSYFAGVDDFAMIYPKFETNISLEVSSKDVYKEGSFANVIFDQKLKKKDYFENNIYETYGYGGSTNKVYRNDYAMNDLNILSICDSFSYTTTIYFPLIAKNCKDLDIRYDDTVFFGYDDFADFYDDYNPDIIIVMINAGTVVCGNTTHDYFGDLQQ